MSWHAERFDEKEGRVRFDCMVCSRPMWFPQCKVGKYKTCGPVCSAAFKSAARNWQACAHCGGRFAPKKSAVGRRFCSRACATAGGAWTFLTTDENLRKASAARRESVAVNGTKHKKGPEHHSWKGGPEEHRKRSYPKRAAYTREYRKRRPEMMREAAKKRRGHGRLPRGTITRIGEAQRWKCAACRADVRKRYHVDHIEPLARGGKHEPRNLQLLCPTCNVRKSAKDPVAFMQSRGFLL